MSTPPAKKQSLILPHSLQKKAAIRHIEEKKLELRKSLWPAYTDDDFWHRKKRKGFTTIPRTLPLFALIMDSLSKGNPVSVIYFDLWCRAHDDCVVSLDKQKEMAFYCGFKGQRAIQTWSARIRTLHELGFINVKEGAHGPLSHAVILNPYKVVQKFSAKRKSFIDEAVLNELHVRAAAIGANDLSE